ncbi:hypothetical protein ET33_33625 [Paenibacillus tyrfis]|uniref:Big-1 domain-containing protein n=1 Tax=Paenibacillus tyrfis TaxID=1501230 RepID=A0A081NTL0_9BACL|nr:hypothetical protein ET33_33625 [Paenibacillus tyrfis]
MKRKRSMSKTVLSFCLAVLLAFQAVMFSANAYAESASINPGTGTTSGPSVSEAVYKAVYAPPIGAPVTLMAAPSDKTAVLIGANSSFSLEVTQDGKVLTTSDAIHGRKPFFLKVTGIKVPVKGDAANPNTVDGNTVILYGDSVMLDRATYFKEIVLPTATKTLVDKSGFKIGTAYFSEAGIKVVFDGEDRFFNGQGQNVTFGFESTATADVSGIGYGDKKPINIFGGSYLLENPRTTPAYSITMKANSNASENGWINQAAFVEGAIEWKVEISATDMFDPAIPQPLEGLTFYDALAQVGTYVEGSLQVNGRGVAPDSGTTNALAYTFPVGFGDKAIVTFKTWIPKAMYYYEYRSSDNGWQTVANTAELRDASGKPLLSSKSWRAALKPDWIQQIGTLDKRVNPADPRTITWTIDVNKNYLKQGLKDFTITDALPNGLTWKSAAWQAWDSAKKDWSATTTAITPNANNVYAFGEVNGPIRLVIVSEVTGSIASFTNKTIAQWKLDGNSVQDNDQATVWDNAVVTIGSHTLTKGGAISQDDFNIGAVTWTVNLTPQEALPDLAVYDLLVYGGSIDLDKVDAGGQVSSKVLQQIKAKGTTPEYWQKYKEGSFDTKNGLQLEVIPLTQNGTRVADLLRVTGYNTDKLASFTFRSVINHPDKFARQGPENGKTRYNRAYLFDGEEYSTHYDAYVNSHGRMLNKEMLYASEPIINGKGDGNKPNYVHNYVRDDSNETRTLAAYDQITNSVTFRLAVNLSGLKTDEMAKDGGNRVASEISLVDTLPDGWEFVPFSEGKDFELWRAESDNGGGYEYGARADAREIIQPTDPRHVVSFSANGNVGTFSFTKLESPYVILVKAKPTESTRKAYFESGNPKTALYNTADLKIKWGDIPTVRTEKRKVIVPMKSLGKSVTKPNPGVLEWTVNYAPPFEMKDGVYLQDTLGEGLALRKDENDSLSLRRPDMAVYRAKLNASGELSKDGDALNLYDPNCEVKVEAVVENGITRLAFRMKNPNQLYQMVYQTEITAVPASGKAGNEIKLMGDDTISNISAKSETAVNSSDVGGSATTQGKLDLKKVDTKGQPLSGVKFTLYKSDGITEVASGTTGADGKLSLYAKAGLYVLKQTYIDETTYLPTTTVYQVRVASTPWNPIWVDGVEVTPTNPLVVPTPVWVPGDLKLDTKIEGKAADPNKGFEYVVTFSNGKSYAYTGSKSGTVASGGTVTLKDGESITIKDIPDGITYTIVQKDYTGDGYATNPANLTRTGSIVAKVTAEAKFVNGKYLPGTLSISQKVAGNGGQPDKEFEFTVTFDGAGKDGTYSYTKQDGSTGTIKSGDKIALKHGESIVITGIPKDTTYTVTEDDYSSQKYAVNLPNGTSSGTIADQGAHRADFVNTRMVYGGLLIGQTVAGNGGETDKPFEYTVTFNGADAGKTYTYAYTKVDGTSTTGTIQSGGTISLKHGETAVIDASQILKGATYTVTQKDYSGDGYTTNPATLTHTGTIEEQKIAEARFVNTKYFPGKLILTANPAVVPGDGKTPSELTATLVDHEGKPIAGRDIVFTLPDNSEVTATTDAQGKAVIPYIPPKLTDATPKVHTITAKTTSTIDGDATASTTVTAMPAAITGVLRDNTTGKVIPNATVTVKNNDTNEDHTITTDQNGAYFLPVPPGGSYTVSYTREFSINGTPMPVTFTQKAEIDNGVTEGKPVPAEITAVGIVLFKQPDGKSSLLNSTFTSKMHVYLQDAVGNYILDQNGVPKAFDLQPNGTFLVNGLLTGDYKMEVRYEFAPGKELTLIREAKLGVAANGELNISQQLVDPYGKITDAKTGAVIEGAEVTLYYADTPKNKANGIVPGTKVTLPTIPGFAPNDNASPSQNSDATGAYAYMVFPDTDYYLVVTKAGYVTHTSATISVGSDIVRYDVQLTPVSSDGNNGTDNDNNGTDSGNNGTGNGNNGTGNGNNGTGNGNNGTGNGNNGTGNGNNGTGNGNNGAGNGNNGTSNGNNGTGNGNNEAGSNSEAANGNNKVVHNNNELDDVPQTGDNSTSLFFYMALALISLIMIGFCLPNRKKVKHIQ